ncbi:MAG: amino acid decarboxylase [Vicinamibacteria bacterium]|nr:amino acid decarboxylase [Vicinamibacteria bacterium]
MAGSRDRDAAVGGDMDPEEFRREGHRVVDWLADYFAHPERFPVLAQVQPGDLVRALPSRAPEGPESFDAIFDDFTRLVVPGITHWNHPGFFAYFAISGSGPGVLAEMLAAGLNVQAMLWRTSPAATELEEVALGWLRDLMHLPPAFEGVIYDTASVAVLHALAAAREAVIADVRTKGLLGRSDVPRVRVYLSAHTHSSADKSVILLGLGKDALAHIPGDANHAMRVDLLREAIAADRRAGILPLAIIATIGTTSSTAIDPVHEIADLCEAEGIWLHVDAAYAGVMAMLPAWRHAFRGAERADTLVVNPHKWLFTPFDCSVLYCRRMDMLRQAFSLVAEYLKTTEAAPVRNLMDTGIQLGRRFRALKLWMVLRYFGASGIRQRLEAHVELARMFAGWVDSTQGWERLAPVPFSVVCFRHHPAGMDDEAVLESHNAAIMDAVNASGEAFLSHTKLDGRYVLRLAIGNIRTEERHVRRVWALLTEAAAALPSM